MIDRQVIQQFIGIAAMHIVTEGCSLHMIPDKTIDGCMGYFTDDGELYVATGHKQNIWFQTFVHEYCHFLQSLDVKANRDINFTDVNDLDFEEFDSWIGGNNDISPERVTELRTMLQSVEADCERRVLELINKYTLPIDSDSYAQLANAYILYYTYVEKNRTWREIAPYRIPEIVATMPTEIITTFDMPDGYELIVEKLCGKPKQQVADEIE